MRQHVAKSVFIPLHIDRQSAFIPLRIDRQYVLHFSKKAKSRFKISLTLLLFLLLARVHETNVAREFPNFLK